MLGNWNYCMFVVFSHLVWVHLEKWSVLTATALNIGLNGSDLEGSQWLKGSRLNFHCGLCCTTLATRYSGHTIARCCCVRWEQKCVGFFFSKDAESTSRPQAPSIMFRSESNALLHWGKDQILEDFGMKFRFFVGLVCEVCLWPTLPSATSVRSRCFGFIFLRIFPAVHLIHCQLMLFRLTLMAHKFKLQNKKICIMETPITFKSIATNTVIGGSKKQKIPAKMFCRAAVPQVTWCTAVARRGPVVERRRRRCFWGVRGAAAVYHNPQVANKARVLRGAAADLPSWNTESSKTEGRYGEKKPALRRRQFDDRVQPSQWR